LENSGWGFAARGSGRTPRGIGAELSSLSPSIIRSIASSYVVVREAMWGFFFFFLFIFFFFFFLFFSCFLFFFLLYAFFFLGSFFFF